MVQHRMQHTRPHLVWPKVVCKQNQERFRTEPANRYGLGWVVALQQPLHLTLTKPCERKAVTTLAKPQNVKVQDF